MESMMMQFAAPAAASLGGRPKLPLDAVGFRFVPGFGQVCRMTALFLEKRRLVETRVFFFPSIPVLYDSCWILISRTIS